MRLMQNLMKRSPSKTASLMKNEAVSSTKNVGAIVVTKSGVAKAEIGKSGIVVFQAMRENGLMKAAHLMSQERNQQLIVKQKKRHGGNFENRA